MPYADIRIRRLLFRRVRALSSHAVRLGCEEKNDAVCFFCQFFVRICRVARVRRRFGSRFVTDCRGRVCGDSGSGCPLRFPRYRRVRRLIGGFSPSVSKDVSTGRVTYCRLRLRGEKTPKTKGDVGIYRGENHGEGQRKEIKKDGLRRPFPFLENYFAKISLTRSMTFIIGLFVTRNSPTGSTFAFSIKKLKSSNAPASSTTI